jgi:hypothetical protein
MGPVKDKFVVVVLGMHRSGTSAVSSLMQQYGFDHGKSLLKPTEYNQKGFFENKSIMQFNDRLLVKLGMHWADPFTFLDNSSYQAELFTEFKSELAGILRQEFTTGNTLVLKDPRICLLLPFWKRAFIEFKLSPLFLHVIRHPDEVVMSLENRNNMAARRAENLWILYNLLAEQNTRSENRMILLFKDILNNFIETGKTIREFLTGKTGLELPELLDQSIDPAFHHYKSVNNMPEGESLSFSLYSLLSDHQNDPSDESVYQRIAELNKKFNNRIREAVSLGDGISARVIVRYKDGTREVSKSDITGMQQTFEIFLSTRHDLESIEVDPANHYCSIRIKAELTKEIDSSPGKMKLHWTNAFYREGELFYFRTVFPQIFFKPESSAIFSSARFHLNYITSGQNALFHFSSLSSVDHAKNKPVKVAANEQVRQIRGSLTWKTGRLILWPFIVIKKTADAGFDFFRRLSKSNLPKLRRLLFPYIFSGPRLLTRIVPSEKKVVYTIILGDYDDLKEPEIVSKGWDYICFTDRDDLHSAIWRIVKIKCPSGLTSKRCSGFFVTNPFKYLNQYELSVLVGGQISIHCDINEFVRNYLVPDKSIILSRHPVRTCIYDEAEKVKDAKKDSGKIVDKQMDKYRREGFPRNYGLVRTGVMIRRHHDKNLIRHGRLWLKEIVKHSQRDQLSFNYILWKYKLTDPGYLPPEIFGSGFRINKHNYKQQFDQNESA